MTSLRIPQWRPIWKAGLAKFADAAEASGLEPIRCDHHFDEALAICRKISELRDAALLGDLIRAHEATARRLHGFLLMTDRSLEEGMGEHWTFDLPAAGIDTLPFLIFATVASLGLHHLKP